MAAPALVLLCIGTALLGLMAYGTHHPVIAYAFFAIAFVAALVASNVRGKRRAQDWEEAAAALDGKFIDAPAAGSLGVFGRAPWNAWGQAVNVGIERAIQGPGDPADFWVLDLSYEDSNGADETTSDDGVTMVIVPMRGELAPQLVEVPVEGGHQAVHNGRYLFLWRRAYWPSIGRLIAPHRLGALIAEARRLARDPDLPMTPPAPRPAKETTLWLAILGWGAMIAAALTPQHTRYDIPFLVAAALMVAFSLEWRRVSSGIHLALLLGVALTIRGAHGPSALMFFGIPLGLGAMLVIISFARPRNTRRDERGIYVWRRTGDPYA
jgi:hypothetical protein